MPSKIIRSLSGVDAQNFVDVISVISGVRLPFGPLRELKLMPAHSVCQALETLELPSKKVRKRCVKALYEKCGRNNMLPVSLQIPLCYDRQGYPVRRGGYADVWRGKYCDQDVAVKVIRTYSLPDLRNIVQVGHWLPPSHVPMY